MIEWNASPSSASFISRNLDRIEMLAGVGRLGGTIDLDRQARRIRFA